MIIIAFYGDFGTWWILVDGSGSGTSLLKI